MSTIDEIVKNNRSNFDFEEPDDGHLERFLTKLEQKQSKPVRLAHKLIKVLKVAALALILLTAGATSWFLLMHSKQVHSAETSELPAELKQVDQYYTQLADQKLLEIDALAKENQVDKTTVDQATNQVTVLLEISKSLIAQYMNLNKDERVFQAIIRNYMLMVSGLDMIVEQVENNTSSTQKSNNHEKN